MKKFELTLSVSLLIFAGCTTSHEGSTKPRTAMSPASAVMNAPDPARHVEGTGQTKSGTFPCSLQAAAEGLYMTEPAKGERRHIPWNSCVTLRRWDDVLVVQFSKNQAPDFKDWSSQTGLLGFSFRSGDKPGLDYLAQWFARYFPKKGRTRDGVRMTL